MGIRVECQQQVEAGRETTTGSYNVGLGTLSGNNNTTGEGNVYLGQEAGFSNSIGGFNVAIGSLSGYSNENALEKVMELRGVTFDWKTEESTKRKFPDGTQIGVIAQEIESVIPEVVKTNDEGYKLVDYSKLTVVLIEAMKEQQKMIEELQEKNRELQQLKKEIEELKMGLGWK